MANVKNAVKKIKQINKTTLAHQQLKSTVKNAIKNTDKAVLAGDKELATSALKVAECEMMRAAQKGVFHKNKASRTISRLSQKVKAL